MQMVSKVVHTWGKVYESSPSLGDGSELLPNLFYCVSQWRKALLRDWVPL